MWQGFATSTCKLSHNTPLTLQHAQFRLGGISFAPANGKWQVVF